MTAVRPEKREAKKILAPVDGGFGDREEEIHDGHKEVEGADNEWEELANKYDQLEKKVKEHLDDEQDVGIREPPVINAPPQLTKEQWERHQVTHTRSSPSSKH